MPYYVVETITHLHGSQLIDLRFFSRSKTIEGVALDLMIDNATINAKENESVLMQGESEFKNQSLNEIMFLITPCGFEANVVKVIDDVDHVCVLDEAIGLERLLQWRLEMPHLLTARFADMRAHQTCIKAWREALRDLTKAIKETLQPMGPKLEEKIESLKKQYESARDVIREHPIE